MYQKQKTKCKAICDLDLDYFDGTLTGKFFRSPLLFVLKSSLIGTHTHASHISLFIHLVSGFVQKAASLTFEMSSNKKVNENIVLLAHACQLLLLLCRVYVINCVLLFFFFSFRYLFILVWTIAIKCLSVDVFFFISKIIYYCTRIH